MAIIFIDTSFVVSKKDEGLPSASTEVVSPREQETSTKPKSKLEPSKLECQMKAIAEEAKKIRLGKGKWISASIINDYSNFDVVIWGQIKLGMGSIVFVSSSRGIDCADLEFVRCL